MIPASCQVFKFLVGSVTSTALATHLYIVYEKKFLFGCIVFVGVLLSLTASNLLDISSLITIMKHFLDSG